MPIQVTIQGTPINIPAGGDAASWADGIDQFVIATSNALAAAVGTFDVSPQSYVLTADINSSISLPNLSFPTTGVRSAIITYNVERVNTGGNSQNETGTLEIVYNGTTWDMTRESTGRILNASNVPFNTFSVTNLGQVQFSSITIGGSFTSGKVTYSAKALGN